MKAQSIIPGNMILRITQILNHEQIKAKTIRDILLVSISFLFFSCAMYYAITSRKNISAQTTEYKMQISKSQKHSF